MRCRVADESVVVKKSRPEKAGNRLEDKTGMTCGLNHGDAQSQKFCVDAKGGSFYEDYRNLTVWSIRAANYPTG
jgi:hypothetical protein